MLGLGPKPLPPQFKLKLPQVHAFVELTVAGGGSRGSVCIEALNERTVTVTALPGVKSGTTGVFSYQNAHGKFRFSARCAGLRGKAAVYALPERIETLQLFTGAQQRGAVRLELTIAAQWRAAPDGVPAGEYARASLSDLSRSGASLMAGRELRRGSLVELRFIVSTASSPITVLAEVMRSSVVETTKKISLGLKFQGVKPEEDRAIMEFINKRQAERRNRGFA